MTERESILQQAHEACLQRNFPQAYALYEGLLQAYPDDIQVLLDYGKAVYIEFEEPEKALRLFEQAVACDPNCVEALLWSADVAALGYGPEQEGAAALYKQAIELDPTCVDAYVGLGLQYQAPSVTLSLEETIQAFRQAIALDPQRADAYNDLGMVLLRKGDKAEARVALCRAIECMQGTSRQRRIPGIKKYIEKIDRDEIIRTGASWNDSPRYRWFSQEEA